MPSLRRRGVHARVAADKEVVPGEGMLPIPNPKDWAPGRCARKVVFCVLHAYIFPHRNSCSVLQ